MVSGLLRSGTRRCCEVLKSCTSFLLCGSLLCADCPTGGGVQAWVTCIESRISLGANLIVRSGAFVSLR
jgi:hypothetical protein